MVFLIVLLIFPPDSFLYGNHISVPHCVIQEVFFAVSIFVISSRARFRAWLAN